MKPNARRWFSNTLRRRWDKESDQGEPDAAFADELPENNSVPKPFHWPVFLEPGNAKQDKRRAGRLQSEFDEPPIGVAIQYVYVQCTQNRKYPEQANCPTEKFLDNRMDSSFQISWVGCNSRAGRSPVYAGKYAEFRT
jgi:hypothetical protein